MKKLISLVLVAIMLFAMIAAAIPASAAPWAYADNIDYVQAKYFDVKPFIDGYVTEAEWGTPSFEVKQDLAAKKGDTDVSPAPQENTYFYKDGTYDATTLKMEYKAWLRWDEKYFYIAVKVTDPDGHTLKNGKNNTWNGDAIQTRIDPWGANYVSFGGNFNPADAADQKNPKPWYDNKLVCDLVFGYCQMAGGFQEAYENVSEKSMISTPYYKAPLGDVDLAIVPAGANYSTDSSNGITTYEIAVPWAYIDGWYFDSFAPAGTNKSACHEYYKNATKEKTESGKVVEGPNGLIGVEYGMSLVVLNGDGTKGANKHNAYLTWGSGVCNAQTQSDLDNAVATSGGNQSVEIVADKVSEDSAYTGSYTTYKKGGIPETKPAPNYSFTIDQSNYIMLDYEDENETHVRPTGTYTDMDIFGYVANGDRVQDTDGNWVVSWNLDNGTGPDSPTESGYNENNYLTTEGQLQDGSDVRWNSENASFTYEFDIKVTGLENFEEGYSPSIYTWFGGSSAVDYRCGYFFDEGKFKVADTKGKESEVTVLSDKKMNFSLNEWHHWVFQYDDDTCTMRFYFDPVMENGRVSKNAVPMFEMFYKYFDNGGKSPFFIFRRMNCQIMMDNIQLYNFVDFTGTNKAADTVVPGGSNKPVEKEEDYDIADKTVEQLEDGSFAIGIPNQDAFMNSNVTAVTFTVNIDATKVSFVGLDKIPEGAYTVTDDKAGKITIKITDLSVIKAVAKGETLLRVIVKPLDGVTLTADEVGSMVGIKATVTTVSAPTGDSIVYISAVFALVLAIGTAATVVIRRKRSTVEF